MAEVKICRLYIQREMACRARDAACVHLRPRTPAFAYLLHVHSPLDRQQHAEVRRRRIL